MKIKYFPAIVAASILLLSNVANAQLGVAMGAGVDQYNMDQELEIGRKHLELQQQRMEIDRQRHEMEMQRHRQAEQERNAKYENSLAVNKLVNETIAAHGSVGTQLLQEINAESGNTIATMPVEILRSEIRNRLPAKIKQAKSDAAIESFLEKYPDYKSGVKKDRFMEEAKIFRQDVNNGVAQDISEMEPWLDTIRERVEKKIAAEKTKGKKQPKKIQS